VRILYNGVRSNKPVLAGVAATDYRTVITRAEDDVSMTGQALSDSLDYSQLANVLDGFHPTTLQYGYDYMNRGAAGVKRILSERENMFFNAYLLR
jgi:hypothetical protein